MREREKSNKSNGVSLCAEGGRRSRKRLDPAAAHRREAFRVKMHHGMGGSVGDRHGVQNPAMQARNGVCDKIENYISELGRWYVSNRGAQTLAGARFFHPIPFRGNGGIGREGANDPGMKVAGV